MGDWAPWIAIALTGVGLVLGALKIQHTVMKTKNDRAFADGRNMERMDRVEKDQRDHEVSDGLVHDQVKRHDEQLKAQVRMNEANSTQHATMFRLIDELPEKIVTRLNGRSK